MAEQAFRNHGFPDFSSPRHENKFFQATAKEELARPTAHLFSPFPPTQTSTSPSCYCTKGYETSPPPRAFVLGQFLSAFPPRSSTGASLRLSKRSCLGCPGYTSDHSLLLVIMLLMMLLLTVSLLIQKPFKGLTQSQQALVCVIWASNSLLSPLLPLPPTWICLSPETRNKSSKPRCIFDFNLYNLSFPLLIEQAIHHPNPEIR